MPPTAGRVRTIPGGLLRQSLRWAGLLALLLIGHLSWLTAICLLPFGVFSFWFAARLGYKSYVGWPLALAGLLGIQCVLQTPPSVRQHDVEGHREYVDYVATTGKLPAVMQGWETWQPPLYYLTAAFWRTLFEAIPQDDPFCSVQYLALILYVATVTLALFAFRRLNFDNVEALGATAILALIPGYVYFAARISNDVLLPLLGTGVFILTAKLVAGSYEDKFTLQPQASARSASGMPQPKKRQMFRSLEQCEDGKVLPALSFLLAATLATKGSSLAMVGGALMLVFWSALRHSNWRFALWRSYLVGLPSGLWLLYWFARTAAQTGNPLYVNAALPEELRVLASPLHRFFSFKIGAFLGGSFYYDGPIRQSYFTALVTSLLYDEYGMGGYGFRCPGLFRWSCLGVIAILFLGALFPPRRELRPVWLTCLILAICQTALTVAYALKFPYACNQNMRFFAQAFVPFAGLFGLGVGRLWHATKWYGRAGVLLIGATFLTGLADFYARLLF